MWGNENATNEDLENALCISQAKEFVDTKEGRLDFMIAQGGKNLSGGQKAAKFFYIIFFDIPAVNKDGSLCGIIKARD